MQPELPTGTVTFLFTDIEGSTRLLRELGDEYADVLAEHRRALREAWRQHDGVEVDTQGDAFFVAFARASDAVAAAAHAQGALADGPVRVRMGLHTGEPLRVDAGYVGFDVHRAARIAAAGHGGQVLLSQATADIAGGDVRDLGLHRLKDLSAPERLFQLGMQAFPPLKTLHETNLPVPATPFLGREREVDEIAALLRRPDVRLVTLTGPGGSGKTRLSLQAAGAAADDYDHGVWWVPLASLADPTLVEAVAAQALGSKDTLPAAVADKRLLLVLDNFEHLLDAAAGVAETIGSCPRLTVLVTSREPLHVSGEWEVAVDPLREREAMELFVQRAAAVRSDFAANGEVVEICQRLDCLPLAIELAAARVKAALAAGTARTARAAAAPARRRLAVGPRAATDPARDDRVEPRSADAGRAGPLRAPGRLRRRLHARCRRGDLRRRRRGNRLARRQEPAPPHRRPLLDARDDSRVRRRTARRARGRALTPGRSRSLVPRARRACAPRVAGSGGSEVARTARLRARESTGSARAPARERERGRRAAALGGDLAVLADTWSLDQGRRYLTAAVALGANLEPERLVNSLWGGSILAQWQGDVDEGEQLASRILEISKTAVEKEHVYEVAIHLLAIVASRRGDRDQALALLEESLAIGRSSGEQWLLSIALNNLGNLLMGEGEYERAIELFEESLAIGEARGDLDRRARASNNLGWATHGLGDLDRAHDFYRRGLEAATEIGLVEGQLHALFGISALEAESGEAHAGARLLGRTKELASRLGAANEDQDEELERQTLARLDAALGPERLASELAAGAALSLEDAIDLALGRSDSATPG